MMKEKAGLLRGAAAVAAICAVCMFSPPAHGAEPVKLKVPFQYRAMGIAGDPEVDIVTLKKGEEGAWASRCLLLAIQNLQFAIPDIKDLASAKLQPRHKYSTDRVPLDAREIAGHNQAYPALAIPSDYSYAVEHQFSFDIADREIQTLIESHLYYKARLTDWKPFKPSYSGQFFSQRLLEAFRKEMARKP